MPTPSVPPAPDDDIMIEVEPEPGDIEAVSLQAILAALPDEDARSAWAAAFGDRFRDLMENPDFSSRMSQLAHASRTGDRAVATRFAEQLKMEVEMAGPEHNALEETRTTADVLAIRREALSHEIADVEKQIQEGKLPDSAELGEMLLRRKTELALVNRQYFSVFHEPGSRGAETLADDEILAALAPLEGEESPAQKEGKHEDRKFVLDMALETIGFATPEAEWTGWKEHYGLLLGWLYDNAPALREKIKALVGDVVLDKDALAKGKALVLPASEYAPRLDSRTVGAMALALRADIERALDQEEETRKKA